MFKKAVNFLKESWEELKKVTWPTKDESINTSIIVIGFIIVTALFLSFVDYGVNAFIMWLVK